MPFSLRANTNLKTLAMLFIEVDPHIGWVVHTIESLQSSNIENILLENFEINYFLSELEFMDLGRMMRSCRKSGLILCSVLCFL